MLVVINGKKTVKGKAWITVQVKKGGAFWLKKASSLQAKETIKLQKTSSLQVEEETL